MWQIPMWHNATKHSSFVTCCVIVQFWKLMRVKWPSGTQWFPLNSNLFLQCFELCRKNCILEKTVEFRKIVQGFETSRFELRRYHCADRGSWRGLIFCTQYFFLSESRLRISKRINAFILFADDTRQETEVWDPTPSGGPNGPQRYIHPPPA